MAHAFVLIDAMPGHEQNVYDALAKFPEVRSRRILSPKVGSADLLVLVEGKDQDQVEKLVVGKLRGIGGVFTVQRMMPQHTVMGNLPRLMIEMEKELGGPKA